MKIRLLISSMVVAAALMGVAHAGEHSVRRVEASAESGIMIALNEMGAKSIWSDAQRSLELSSIIRKNIRSDAQIIDS